MPDGPLVLGHEPGGVVVEVGPGVEGFAVGDRVALEPGVPCGHCEDCLKGHYNLCQHVKFMAIPGERDGVFSEYCTHAASMTFHLPDNVSTMEGALMEPLAVGMHACELSNAKIGQSAVVLGCGCIGLVTIMSLRARGITEIYAADILELDIATLNAMEGTIYSVYRYRNLYPTAIQAVSSGLIPLKKIVSHVFDFADVIEGVDYSLNHKDEVIKSVIRF